MKERLRQIIEYYNISVNAFSVKNGINESTIRKILTENTSIRSDNLAKIAENFPEINLDWLITGRGEMIFSQAASPTPHNASADALALIADLARENGQLQAENAELKKELARAGTTMAVSAKAVNE